MLASEGGRVQQVISELVTRFERGRLTRRELVQALTAVALTAGAPAAAASLKAGSTSTLVSDMARSIRFPDTGVGSTNDAAHFVG
jgi:hypothetical protein